MIYGARARRVRPFRRSSARWRLWQEATCSWPGARIELQPAAMDALLAAREEALKQGLDITPRGGTEAARRSFQDTLRLWDTRFLPALAYWSKRGRLSREQVAHLRSL